MQYMGSKGRLSKYILPIMLRYRAENQAWVEPFVGGGNVIDKVPGMRIGADINRHAIEALISIRDHIDELPKSNQEFTKEDYEKIRQGAYYKYKSYAGFSFSYGAGWLNSWSRNNINTDYVARAYRHALKQNAGMQGVELINESYLNLQIPANSLIYCDPPYLNTAGYNTNFNHDEFWDWCRQKAQESHIVFVSEYTAPDGIECIYERLHDNKLNDTKVLEKLFLIKPDDLEISIQKQHKQMQLF